jgi:hypothetical protein
MGGVAGDSEDAARFDPVGARHRQIHVYGVVHFVVPDVLFPV